MTVTHASRRDTLLDSAATLIEAGGADAVTMEAVAEHAGVSRPLVYKHFANRSELLQALYARESEALHVHLASAVAGATTLEEMLRALVRGSLEAQAARGATFATLRAAGSRTVERKQEQRRRDAATLRFFLREAMARFGLEEKQARAGVAIVLGAIDAVLSAWRARPTKEQAQLLEDTYVTMAMGGLAALAERGR
ncbi:MAG TPA: helix-turn-helix domain-containing protein [Acidimicrobiales bacterium]|nr:helix-turn-helix domain-containing protein [Acidimicrobiales bacterium]